jgi:hypothetical protein
VSAGSDWVEQARRLLESLSTSHGHDAAAAGEADGGDAARTPAEGCRYCPHCQVSAVLRGERPEVSAALADILTATSNALKTFAAGPGPEPAPGPAGEPTAEPSSAEPSSAGPSSAGPSSAGPSDAGRDGGLPPDVQRIEIA